MFRRPDGRRRRPRRRRVGGERGSPSFSFVPDDDFERIAAAETTTTTKTTGRTTTPSRRRRDAFAASAALLLVVLPLRPTAMTTIAPPPAFSSSSHLFFDGPIYGGGAASAARAGPSGRRRASAAGAAEGFVRARRSSPGPTTTTSVGMVRENGDDDGAASAASSSFSSPSADDGVARKNERRDGGRRRSDYDDEEEEGREESKQGPTPSRTRSSRRKERQRERRRRGVLDRLASLDDGGDEASSSSSLRELALAAMMRPKTTTEKQNDGERGSAGAAEGNDGTSGGVGSETTTMPSSRVGSSIGDGDRRQPPFSRRRGKASRASSSARKRKKKGRRESRSREGGGRVEGEDDDGLLLGVGGRNRTEAAGGVGGGASEGFSSSLLPPPLPSSGGGPKPSKKKRSGGRLKRGEDGRALGSWGDFFSEQSDVNNNRGKSSGGAATTRSDEDSYDGRGDEVSGQPRSFLPPLFPALDDDGKGGVAPTDDAGLMSSDPPSSLSSRLPSIDDLFSPSSSASSTPAREDDRPARPSSATAATSSSALDGVLPVSELFYRSTQSLSTEDRDEDEDNGGSEEADAGGERPKRGRRKTANGSDAMNVDNAKANKHRRGNKDQKDDDDSDDEELPFSAEQTDRLTTNGNKIRIRRNNAAAAPSSGDGNESDGNGDAIRYQEETFSRRTRRRGGGGGRRRSAGGGGGGGGDDDGRPSGGRRRRAAAAAAAASNGGRKMVRRGMEMLVGGVPINADPPQKSLELRYDASSSGLLLPSTSCSSSSSSSSDNDDTDGGSDRDWSTVITTDARDFGPLLHGPSATKVSEFEKGLFCEHFVERAMKWDVCPKDLKGFARAFRVEEERKERERKRKEQEERREEDEEEERQEERKTTRMSGAAPDGASPEEDDAEAKGGAVEASAGGASEGGSSVARGGAGILTLLDNDNGDDEEGNGNGHASKDAKERRPSASARGFGGPARGFGKKPVEATRRRRGKDRSKPNEDADEGGEEDGRRLLSPPSSFHETRDVRAGPSRGGHRHANRATRRHPTPLTAPSSHLDGGGGGEAEDDVSGAAAFALAGELKFGIGASRSELESGRPGPPGHVLRRVLARGVSTAVRASELGFDVKMARMSLSEVDGGGGYTDISAEFTMEPREPMEYVEATRHAERINAALARAMDDGDMALAMAKSAREEGGWERSVRERVVEELLFEEEGGDDEPLLEVDGGEDDDDGDPEGGDDVDDNGPFTEAEGAVGSADVDDEEKEAAESEEEEKPYDGPFGMPGAPVHPKDDLYLGGGNGGVFPDYSASNADGAPFSGRLGPILLDAVASRCAERHHFPRVIAVGDVHGCIDELQDLLRRCDYRPGDLVVFLGDLVSKGPDSVSVVQMAREMGALGVRGNHDFEVIRWHQAIKSGVDPPVVGSEHYHIAMTMSTADLKWMYSLPWYISSKELGALFVHAGFVSGIRLAKQNPRLMMNMRSILPDGTVTSKFFNNWPWARLWDGPQTVLFGHDADRGLQQYEHAIGLDTGCVYGGRLTACVLPERRLVSVPARREYFKYRRKHYTT